MTTSLTWGFPAAQGNEAGRQTQAREQHRRSQEAEGEKGMPKIWFSVCGEPLSVWAGLWRVSGEW